MADIVTARRAMNPALDYGVNWNKVEIPDLTHKTTLLYKSRNGEIKELVVVQSLEPGKLKLTFTDLQILAREISNVLRSDG